MTNYDYKERKEYIGSSDIAELTLRNEGKTQPLHFGEDGSYHAWIICNISNSNSIFKTQVV